MRHVLLFALVLFTAAQGVMAQPVDTIGGPDGSTQTIHHCGYLPVIGGRYTDSAVATRIIQHKLWRLGYYRATVDGVNGRATKAAVRAFQTEYGLAADGVVGPNTAQRLAYVTHSSRHVQGCWRLAHVGA